MTTASTSVAVPRMLRRPSVTPVFAVLFVGLVLFWLIENLVRTPADFYANFIFGATNGLVYGLIAIGYSLVYGILELINFAHGDVFMLGGMLTATLVASLTLSAGEAWFVLWPSVLLLLVAAAAFCGTLNASIERVAYRRLRSAPRLAPLITAIGMSFVLQNVGLIWKGARPISVPSILPTGPVFTIGGVSYTWNEFVVLLITIPVLAGLTWLVQRTRRGKAMRATAQDREAAAMMGIDVDRTISFTFLLAGGLAGVAGVVFALYTTNLSFLTGFRTGLIAFTAAVLGGIGNLSGAVLGAIIIGMIQAFNEGPFLWAPGSDWTRSIVFGILIAILVFKPTGLLGQQLADRA